MLARSLGRGWPDARQAAAAARDRDRHQSRFGRGTLISSSTCQCQLCLAVRALPRLMLSHDEPGAQAAHACCDQRQRQRAGRRRRGSLDWLGALRLQYHVCIASLACRSCAEGAGASLVAGGSPQSRPLSPAQPGLSPDARAAGLVPPDGVTAPPLGVPELEAVVAVSPWIAGRAGGDGGAAPCHTVTSGRRHVQHRSAAAAVPAHRRLPCRPLRLPCRHLALHSGALRG